MKNSYSYHAVYNKDNMSMTRTDIKEVLVKPVIKRDWLLGSIWKKFKPDIDWDIDNKDEEEVMFCKSELIEVNDVPMSDGSNKTFFIKIKSNIDTDKGERYSTMSKEDKDNIFRMTFLSPDFNDIYMINFGEDILGEEILDNISEYNYYN